jgi:hypothetical protein
VSHVEFPELTPAAKKSLVAGYKAAFPWHDGHKKDWSERNRKGQAAFLREAMKQTRKVYDLRPLSIVWWEALEAIADNLHSPPPPPPTLAQARAADLDTPEGKAAVRAFLATLGEEEQ